MDKHKQHVTHKDDMKTKRKPFQPRFNAGLTQPCIQPQNVGEVKHELMLQHRECDEHFTDMVRTLAQNNRADSVVKANVLVWQQKQSDRLFNKP